MSMGIRTVLIDDEAKSMAALRNLIKDYCPEVEVVGEGNSVESGLKAVESLKPELVFLDIAMPDGDGFELLEKTNYKEFEVIFTTAYDEYAIQAFEFSALHYLLKPIDIEKLEEAVQRFAQQEKNELQEDKIEILQSGLAKTFSRIALPSQEGLHFVSLVEILRCESYKNYTTFFMTNGNRITVSKPLSKYEALLSGSHFIRVHNQHLINLNHIQSYIRGKGGYVILTDGTEVDVSVRKKEEFLKKMAEFTGSA